MNSIKHRISVILFDYGGVLADEGFRNGLATIARRHGLQPETLLNQATDAIYQSGYVLGAGSEKAFWKLLKERSGIEGDISDLRNEILQRFRLRPWMLDVVDELRNDGYRTGILSDQTDWLDELEARDHFFHHFDVIFNSYHLGMGKRDPEVFRRVAKELGAPPEQILFIDDAPGNIERAQSQGLKTILFVNRERFEQALKHKLSAAAP
ncbi:HAD family hydrolase [Thiolapillus sp.]